MIDDLDGIDENELREADALARALDGLAAEDAPRDVLETSAFLRAARRSGDADSHVAALESRVLRAPRRARVVRLVFGVSAVLSAAAAVLLVVRSETPVESRPSEGAYVPAPPPEFVPEAAPTPPPAPSRPEREMGDVGAFTSRPAARASSHLYPEPSEAARLDGDAGWRLAMAESRPRSPEYVYLERVYTIVRAARLAPRADGLRALASARALPVPSTLPIETRRFVRAELADARRHVERQPAGPNADDL